MGRPPDLDGRIKEFLVEISKRFAELNEAYLLSENIHHTHPLAKNIFNVFPDEYSEGRTAGFLGAIYPLNFPNGFNGGHYYLRMGWDF